MKLGSDISWLELHDTGFPYSSDTQMRQAMSSGKVRLGFDRGMSLLLVGHGFPGSQGATWLVRILNSLRLLLPIVFAVGVILTKHYWYLFTLALFIPAWFLSYTYSSSGGNSWRAFLTVEAISLVLLFMNLTAWGLLTDAMALEIVLPWFMIQTSVWAVRKKARASDAFVHFLWKSGLLSLRLSNGELLYCNKDKSFVPDP
jgi:hypothetical protein